jgi:transposase
MAMTSPFRVVLTEEDRRELTRRSRSERRPHREVQRAAIVLAAAEGTSNAAIAGRLGICVDTARKWRARFCARGLAGLADWPRPGRRRTFPKTAEVEVKALACELPAETDVPLARWSYTELAAEAVTRGVVETISPSTVGRWLRADAIRPWRHRSWIFPRDPDFAGKAARGLDLYDRTWNGQPLGADEYVLSADEKVPTPSPAAAPSRPPAGAGPDPTTGIRVPPRRHPGLPGRLRRPRRPRHRPHRTHHRHRAVRGAGRAGDDHRALRQRGPGVLDRRQRLLA